MASSLETNKLLAAVLTAGIFASGAGVVSRIIYHPTAPEEPAYLIEVVEEGEGGGDEGGGEAVSVAALLASADAAGGESGAKKCSACHGFDEGGADKIGPNLYGVLGREIASVSGFEYSEALAGLDGEWDYEALDGFLANPKEYAPGTKMAYAGMKSGQDRADLILYLRSLAADPLPLPEAEAVETEAAGEAEGGESEGDTEQAAEGEAPEDTAEEAEGLADAAMDDAGEVVEEVEDAAGEVADAAGDVVEGAEETASEAAETASDAAAETVDAAEEAVDDTADAAESAVEGASEETADAAEAVSDATGDAADAAAGAAGATAAAVNEAASETEEAAEETAAAAADSAGDAAEAAEETVEETAEAAGDAAEKSGDAAAGGLVAMIADGDVAKGEKVSKKCKACHVFEEGGKNKLGPALWGIVGRDIASHEGFNYSGALKELDGAWTYEELDQFLAAPKTYASGTKMVFAGVKKEQDRADLIAYLRTLAAEPAPLE